MNKKEIRQQGFEQGLQLITLFERNSSMHEQAILNIDPLLTLAKEYVQRNPTPDNFEHFLSLTELGVPKKVRTLKEQDAMRTIFSNATALMEPFAGLSAWPGQEHFNTLARIMADRIKLNPTVAENPKFPWEKTLNILMADLPIPNIYRIELANHAPKKVLKTYQDRRVRSIFHPLTHREGQRDYFYDVDKAQLLKLITNAPTTEQGVADILTIALQIDVHETWPQHLQNQLWNAVSRRLHELPTHRVEEFLRSKHVDAIEQLIELGSQSPVREKTLLWLAEKTSYNRLRILDAQCANSGVIEMWLEQRRERHAQRIR